jgi:hypothetical protein
MPSLSSLLSATRDTYTVCVRLSGCLASLFAPAIFLCCPPSKYSELFSCSYFFKAAATSPPPPGYRDGEWAFDDIRNALLILFLATHVIEFHLDVVARVLLFSVILVPAQAHII